MTPAEFTKLSEEAKQARELLTHVTAHLRHRLPKVSKCKTLRDWAMSKRDHAEPQVAREAETTLAILDLLGED